MPHAPGPPPRHPLPDIEPTPAKEPFYDQRAGDLQVGHVCGLNEFDARPRRKKQPVGFRAPEPSR